MEKQALKLEKIIAGVIYILFIVGAIGHTIASLRPLMISLTPYTLIITSMLILFYELKKGNYGFFTWGLLVFLFTFFIESIGVKTGLIFGNYLYGNTLGAKITGVPLIIGINWIFVITGATIISSYAEKGIILTPLLVAVFTVIFDIFLEPVAVKLDYWIWSDNIIPLQNYYAWFIISYLISFTYFFYRITCRSTLAAKFFVVQFIFFAYLNWVL